MKTRIFYKYLFRLTNFKYQDCSILLFGFNHGIDDQRSIHILLEDLLQMLHTPSIYIIKASHQFPPSIESTINQGLSWKTISWAIYQLGNSLQNPIMLPFHITKKLKSKITSKEESDSLISTLINPNLRSTNVRFVTLPSNIMNSLIQQAKKHQVTVTHLLAATMSIITASHIRGLYTEQQSDITTEEFFHYPQDFKIRFLLSVGLRSYGCNQEIERQVNDDFTGGTVACASGALDYLLPASKTLFQTFQQLFSKKLATNGKEDSIIIITTEKDEINQFMIEFWQLAQESQLQAAILIQDQQYVPESVQLMDFGFQYVDILQAVEIDANHPKNLGRGYTCGVSNMGRFQPQLPPSSKMVSSVSSGITDISYQIDDIYYATSHSRNGNLLQLSCITNANNGQWYGCLQFPTPIVTEKEADIITTILTDLLTLIANKS
jgi:hypothetical protein